MSALPNQRDAPVALLTPSAMTMLAAEDRRQRALDSLALDDSVHEERFDRITRLARRALDAPLAYITVLDRQHAWWPSIDGVDRAEMPQRLPREQTLCDVTQRMGEPVQVADARLDPRCADLDAVTSGMVVSYAGFPLRDPMGHVLGTLCISDTVPRLLDEEDLETLADLARWAEQELTAPREMRLARQLQVSMLPREPVAGEGWDVAGLCLPALAAGGDFYDYDRGPHVLHVVLGDVMGKGSGAALVGAGVRAALRATTPAVAAGVDLGVTTTEVARSLRADLERHDSFVTVFQAAVDLEDGTARFVDAGAGLGLLVRGDGTLQHLAGADRPLGALPDDHWVEHEVGLDPGDRLVVVSNGVLDLLDDPTTWRDALARLVRDATDVSDLMGAIGLLTRRRTPLDDVTVVAVFREPRQPRLVPAPGDGDGDGDGREER